MKNDKQLIFIIGVITLVLLGGFVWWNSSQPSSQTPVTVSGQDTEQKLYLEKEITHGHGLAVDVTDPNKLYIATHNGLLVLINEKDLYRIGASRDDYMGFSVHPTDHDTFFSSGHPVTGGNVGFQKSEDGGMTWQRVSNGLNGPVDFHAMTVSPVNPDLVFGWFQGNVQRSEDGGKTWVKFATPVPVVALAADTSDQNKVYTASPQGLFVSQNKGETWEPILDGFVAVIAVHPSDPQILLISSEKLRLAKSTDGGKNWQTIQANLNGESALFIAFSKEDPQTVYVLTEKNSVYKSQDEGMSWNKIR